MNKLWLHATWISLMNVVLGKKKKALKIGRKLYWKNFIPNPKNT